MSLDLQLDLQNMRPFSRLFCPSPQGIGTPLPEACTSFLSRVSTEHSVTMSSLLIHEILPAMGEQHLSLSLQRGSSRIFARPSLFNSHNTITEKLINALKKLTLSEGLPFLTLLPLRGLLDSKNIFRSHRAWCIHCLEQMKRRKAAVYESLTYLIKLVNVCPVHGTPLTSKCPACGRALPIIARTSTPGYCSFCRNSLLADSNDTSSSKNDISEFDGWAAHNIGLLLSALPTKPSLLSRTALISEILKYLDNRYNGNASAFARAFNIPIATVKHWREGISFPSLEHLLVISFSTRTDLVDLVTVGIGGKNIPSPSNETLDLFPRLQISITRFNRTKAKRFLQRVLRSQTAPLPTMSVVVKKLGCSKKTLYKHFPALCRAIAAKAAKYRNTRKEERIRQENLFVERTVEQLYLDGIYPSYDAVEKIAQKKGILRSREARRVWHKKLASLGLRDNTSLDS